MPHRTALPLVLAAAATSAMAQPALVKDLNTARDPLPGSSAVSSEPRAAAVVNGRYFIPVDDGVHGFQMWVSDGTPAGTHVLRDFPAGPASMATFESLGVGAQLFYNGSDPGHGMELWVSDGTSAGTRLAADINPGAPLSQPQYFAAFNNALFFRVYDSPVGAEVFRSDGTTAGTFALIDATPGRNAASRPASPWPVATSSSLYFTTSSGGLDRLWTSDGTTPGTSAVPGAVFTQIYSLTATSNLVYFVSSNSGVSQSLMRSDGTASGTFTLPVSPNPQTLAYLAPSPQGLLAFLSYPGGGFQLWKTDGTSTGTRFVASPPVSFNDGWDLPVLAGAVTVFAGSDAATGSELWRTDGTLEGTVAIDLIPGPTGSAPRDFVPAPDRSIAFFSATSADSLRQIWRTDGTLAGTWPVSSFPSTTTIRDHTLRDVNGDLFFVVEDPSTGVTLWKSSGEPNDATLISTLRPVFEDGPSNPYGYVRVGARVCFAARTPDTGIELWVTDGRPNSTNTRLVKDINPGGANSISSWQDPINNRPACAFGDLLICRATTASAGSELWRSDGTTAGTYLVRDLIAGASSSVPDQFVALSNAVIFTALETAGGSTRSIWRTDGTSQGTTMIRPAQSLQTTSFVKYRDAVYFGWSDAASGAELWRTSGAADGSDTVLVANIVPGTGSSFVNPLGVVNDRLLFLATTVARGRELWSTQGTTATTVLLKDIAPGSPSSNISRFTIADGRAYFLADAGDGTGIEIWVTDSTDAGTHRVIDLVPGPQAPDIRAMVASGSRLYFIADTFTGIGPELYVTDGTEQGTRLVADLIPGNNNLESEAPANLAPAPDGNVVFTVPDPQFGYELWESDGTPEGTRRVSDISPGLESSWPEKPFLFNRTVLFAAYRPDVHRELFSYRFAGGPCPCDWNDSAAVTSDDFFAFLVDFFAGVADFDNSGDTTAQDFFDFLSCFFASPCG